MTDVLAAYVEKLRVKEPEVRLDGTIHHYCERDQLFFVGLVKDGMPRWEVRKRYNLPVATLHSFIKLWAPELIGSPGWVTNRRRGKRNPKRTPGDVGRSNYCPRCSPNDAPAADADKEQRHKWGFWDAGPRVQLCHATNGDGQAYAYCPKCGYEEDRLP